MEDIFENIAKLFIDFYNFIFETYMGVEILVIACALISLIFAFFLEIRTQNKYYDHSKNDD